MKNVMMEIEYLMMVVINVNFNVKNNALIVKREYVTNVTLKVGLY